MKKNKKIKVAQKQASLKPVQQPKKTVKKTSYTNFIYLSVIVLLGTVIYSNTFDCSFHFDDFNSIVNNANIRNLNNVNAIWNWNPPRFVTYYSFAVNYHFAELDVWGYHFVNLAIHLINACLVFWLTLLILSCPAFNKNPATGHKKTIAFLAALMFVSHPLATQSVTYIVQRLSSLVTLFYLLSLVFYVKARLTHKNNLSKYLLFAGSLISALLAMFTKENAYTLPVAIVLFEIFFLQTKKLSINFKNYRIYLFLIVFLSVIALAFLKFPLSVFKPVPPSFGNPYAITSTDYFYTQFSVILKYIQLLFLPVQQNLDYDFPVSHGFFEARTLISLLLLLSLLILAIYLFKKNRIISFGIFWFFLTLSVESSLIPLSDVINEHRTYLPSFGFFLILSIIIRKLLWNKYKYAAILLFVVITGSNSVLTWQRNKIWVDDLTLMNDAATKSPRKARPFGSRADCYRDLGQFDKAIADYSRAIRINPKYSTAYHNRAGIYSKLDQLEKALSDYSSAIAADPKYTKAWYNRGNIWTKLGKWDNAITDYDKTIEIDPTFTYAYYARGAAYNHLRMWDKAITDLNRTIEYKFTTSDTYFNRGFAYYNLGQWDKAIEDYSRTIEIEPKFPNAWYYRGIVYDKLKQWDKSISDYSHAIEIDQKFVPAYVNRGVAYGNLGQWDKSVEDYSSALAIDPNFKLAYSNREVALSRLRSGK